MVDNKKVWENIYNENCQMNRYPWDVIVSFIYRQYPKEKERKDVKILEVGCGSGSNLWFAAREGFDVTGIDISESAITYARKRFKDDGIQGKFIIGDLGKLPFKNEQFDLVIDRAALTYLNPKQVESAISEIKRVLKINGKMFFNPFSDMHSSCVSGVYMENGMTTDIKFGIKNCGDTFFYGRRDIYELFGNVWKLESVQHSEVVEQVSSNYFVYADWRVIAKKIDDNN